MTILAFWEVGYPGDGHPARGFYGVPHEYAFKRLWENRDKWGVKLYDIETDEETTHTAYKLLDGCDFEVDYNNELLNGGYWVLVLRLRSDYVKQVIGE